MLKWLQRRSQRGTVWFGVGPRPISALLTLLQELNDYRALLLNHPEQYRLQEKLEEEGWQGLSRTEQQTLRLPSVIV